METAYPQACHGVLHSLGEFLQRSLLWGSSHIITRNDEQVENVLEWGNDFGSRLDAIGRIETESHFLAVGPLKHLLAPDKGKAIELRGKRGSKQDVRLQQSEKLPESVT